MKYRGYVAIIAIVILLGSILNLTPIEPVYASHNSNHNSNNNGNNNSNNNSNSNNDQDSHFTFGPITSSSPTIQLQPGSPTLTTISIPVTNTHQTLASSVNPGEGNTFINLFAAGTANNINSQFTITRTDSVTVIAAGATATLTYTVSTTALTNTGNVDLQAFASGRLPPPEQGAVQIQLHTVTSQTAGNVFTVSRASSLSVQADTGVTTFSADNGSFSSLTRMAESTLPSENKPTLNFPYGIYAFTISNLSNGATITITITFPSDIPAGSQYWKVQGNTWVKLPDELVGDNDGDNILTLTLTDGGTGDSDGLANGTIVDPGGPATFTNTASVVGPGSSGGSCDGRIVVTNDRKVGGRCVIFDVEPPKIIKAFVTVNDFLCIKGTDDTGIARVTVNGIEFAPWSGTSGAFCAKGMVNPDETFLRSGIGGSFSAKGIVKLGETFSISATDFAGNNAGAVVLASKELRKTTKAFAAYVDKEYNPHVGIEAIVIENPNHEPLKQVRLMLSSDMDRGRFVLSDYALKQIDNSEKVTIVMNTKYNSKEFQGYLIVSASNAGILTVLPVDVKASDFHIGKPLVNQKKQTVYLDTIDTGKLIPAKRLNSLQMAEFDRALQAIVDGESLTPTQHRILRYAISS